MSDNKDGQKADVPTLSERDAEILAIYIKTAEGELPKVIPLPFNLVLPPSIHILRYVCFPSR
jgi:hypothetical protein